MTRSPSGRGRAARRAAPSPPNTDDTPMSAKDVAEWLRISTHTVHRWKKEGRIPPPLKRVGNRDYWSSKVLEDWWEESEA